MTGPLQRPLKTATILGLCAFLTGGAVTAAGVKVLLSYGNIHDVLPVMSSQTLHFPETKDALDKMSAELARQGQSLAKIEPAAGDK